MYRSSWYHSIYFNADLIVLIKKLTGGCRVCCGAVILRLPPACCKLIPGLLLLRTFSWGVFRVIAASVHHTSVAPWISQVILFLRLCVSVILFQFVNHWINVSWDPGPSMKYAHLYPCSIMSTALNWQCFSPESPQARNNNTVIWQTFSWPRSLSLCSDSGSNITEVMLKWIQFASHNHKITLPL